MPAWYTTGRGGVVRQRCLVGSGQHPDQVLGSTVAVGGDLPAHRRHLYPVDPLVLQGTLATVVLAVVWGGALAGTVLDLAGSRRPDGSVGPCIWPLAGWPWWPCRSCSPASA
jgi:hypothetical protein